MRGRFAAGPDERLQHLLTVAGAARVGPVKSFVFPV
jgi:hypothetical protein